MYRLCNLFNRLEISKDIISPILVNMISAFFLFVMIIAFKEPFLKLLGVWEEVEEYPIYCIVEPFIDRHSSKVHADLFIINLKDKRFSGRKALEEELKKIVGIEEASRIGTGIRLKWKESFEGEIEDIEPQIEFNKDKGQAIPNKLKEGDWEISINWIKERGIIKFKILTSWNVPYISRASRQSVPFSVDYPGRK